MIDVLKAIAHPTRFRIIETLSGRELNVGEIEDASEISQPALSQQLAVLRNAGLVETRKDAKLIFYKLDLERFAELAQIFGELSGTSSKPATEDRHQTQGVANFARLT